MGKMPTNSLGKSSDQESITAAFLKVIEKYILGDFFGYIKSEWSKSGNSS